MFIKIRALSLSILMALVIFILLDDAGIVEDFNKNYQTQQEVSYGRQDRSETGR